MILSSFPRSYARAIWHFAGTRAPEVVLLQASPALGALFGNVGNDWPALARLLLLLLGSIALTAHVFVFNDWAGRGSDANDRRRAARVFRECGITAPQAATLAIALLVAAISILAVVGTPAVLFGAGIAALSLLYSGSRLWGKGRPIVASLLHLVGGTFHFLLGYTMCHAVDRTGVGIAIFFGLVFAGGHLNQEVRDYEADLRNRIRTTAVAFGRRRAFLSSLLTFTAAYLLLAVLALCGVVARPLIYTAIFWPWHVLFCLQALRTGLGFEAAIWMQKRYRLQFALLGFAMLLTTAPVAELARRAHQPADKRVEYPSATRQAPTI